METYVGILRRHVKLSLLVVVVTTAAAYFVAARQAPAYQATSEVLVNRTPAVLLPDSAPSPSSDALSLNRLVSTQSQLASTPQIAAAALAQAGVHSMSPQQLVGNLAVASKPNADLITFTLTAATPQLAERLATAYAGQFSAYQQRVQTSLLNQQAHQIQGALRSTSPGPVRDRLKSALTAVQAAASDSQPSSTVISSATSATQTAPKPARTTGLALALGLLLGCLLPFLIDALDKRAHSTSEIGDQLALNPLARIPAPTRRRGRSPATVAMLTDPGSPQAEAIKMLQANLELACLDRERPLTRVMFTSAVRQEGKSTTVANVAVSLAQAGRNVVVVDGDLRWPSLARLFGAPDEPGLTELALGEVATYRLDGFLTDIPLDAAHSPPNVRGRLRLLAAGRREEQPDRLLSSATLESVFITLASRVDIVLVDSPPLTEVYDGLILSQYVDAVIPVTRLSQVRLPELAEFGRLLATMSAPALGYVATGVPSRDIGRYELPRGKPAAAAGRSDTAGVAHRGS
jgi:capsular exopolysaccharide synthesis family protein